MREAEECNGVRQEEGVAQCEFGIKIPSTMQSFFVKSRGTTVISAQSGGQPAVGRGRPGQGSDSALTTETKVFSCPWSSTRPLGLGFWDGHSRPSRPWRFWCSAAGPGQVSQGERETGEIQGTGNGILSFLTTYLCVS